MSNLANTATGLSSQVVLDKPSWQPQKPECDVKSSVAGLLQGARCLLCRRQSSTWLAMARKLNLSSTPRGWGLATRAGALWLRRNGRLDPGLGKAQSCSHSGCQGSTSHPLKPPWSKGHTHTLHPSHAVSGPCHSSHAGRVQQWGLSHPGH